MPLGVSESAYASFERNAEELLRFDREFHRQLLENFAAEAAHDHRHRVLGAHSALLAVEDLILADLRRRRLVLQRGGVVLDLDVREGMCSALVADEHRVALGVVARAFRLGQNANESTIAVVALA